MILTLLPVHALTPADTALSVSGDTLTCDGIDYDLSGVPEGGEGLPEGTHPFVGPIRRVGGVIHAQVIVRLGLTAAPRQPDDDRWTVAVAEGPVPIPAERIAE